MPHLRRARHPGRQPDATAGRVGQVQLGRRLRLHPSRPAALDLPDVESPPTAHEYAGDGEPTAPWSGPSGLTARVSGLLRYGSGLLVPCVLVAAAVLIVRALPAEEPARSTIVALSFGLLLVLGVLYGSGARE